jgi:hypothetical protein
VLRQPVARDGQWQLLECVPAWEGNWTSDCFLAFAWQSPAGERLLVVVNYAPNQSQCYVPLPFADLGNRQWRLQDQMGSASYDRAGNDLQSQGLYVDMPPWRYHVLSLQKLL